MAKFYFEDVFNLTGRGVVICGPITEGDIKSDDIVIFPDGQKFAIRGIEMFRKLMDGAGTGDNIGILIGTRENPANKSEISKFRKSTLDILSKEEIRNKKIEDLGI